MNLKKHILVVDDEQSIRELCKEFLEDEGYQVTVAVDGEDALEKLKLDYFDLFLIDIMMPRMDGFELMLKIKKRQPLSVIIITTGYSSIDGAVKAVHAGAFQYLSKPINPEELIDVVKKGLKYNESLFGPAQQAFETEDDTQKQDKPLILSGFTTEEKQSFLEMGRLRNYEVGDSIVISEEHAGSIILVEKGEISIWLENTTVDFLRRDDTWGEEEFILTNSSPTALQAEVPTTIRFFEHKKMLDFFAYRSEKLLKRFLINLANSIFFKWRKSLQRIVRLKLVDFERK